MPRLEDDYNDIFEKARQGLDLSVRALADKAGVSTAEITAAESGERVPSDALIQSLGLNVENFKRIVEEKYDPKAELLEQAHHFPVEVGGMGTNAYIFEKDKKALLIDSIGASEEALAYIKTNNLEPIAALITHGHFDHTAGVEILKQQFTHIKVIEAGKDVHKDGPIDIPEFSVHVYTTPGHSEDSVCYYIDTAVLFSGDTLFAGSVGRANYSYQSLLSSIKEKLFTLQDSTIVCPGHGPSTTIGEEKNNNPFF